MLTTNGNTDLNTVTTASLNMLATFFPAQRNDFSRVISEINTGTPNLASLPKALKRINANILQDNNLKSISFRLASESIRKEVKKLRALSGLSAEQSKKLEDIKLSEDLDVNDAVLDVIKALKLFASDVSAYRNQQQVISSGAHPNIKSNGASNIIASDIACSSKRVVKCFLPMLKRLYSEFPTDTTLSSLIEQSEACNKDDALDFYKAIDLMEECSRYVAVLQSKRNSAEAEFLQAFNGHLESMHKVIEHTSKSNAKFLQDSDKDKASIDGILVNFHASTANEDDPEKLKRIIKSNIDAMKKGVSSVMNKQSEHINKQQAVIRVLGDRVKDQEGRIALLFKKKELLKNAIESIESLSNIDALTGAFNRKAYDTYVAELDLLKEENGTDYSLIIIDIDKFKSINDQYGHITGDKILVALTRLVTTKLSKIADVDCKFFRYGGEEFVIVCKNLGLKKAIAISEHTRAAIEKRTYTLKNELISITASLGVASCANVKGGNTAVFESADAALYKAKNNGRNKIFFNHKGKSIEYSIA